MNSHKRKFANPIGKNQYTARRWDWSDRSWTTRELAVAHGFPYQALHNRLVLRGWSLEKALTTPLEPRPLRNEKFDTEIPKERMVGLRMSFDL
jgi:hypothetical protein